MIFRNYGIQEDRLINLYFKATVDSFSADALGQLEK